MRVVREVLAARNLPGELHSFPFHNFGQARNQALEICRASSGEFSHLLLLDADMELVVEQAEWPPPLQQAQYLLRQRIQDLSWANIRVIGRDLACHYVGRTHEYLSRCGPLLPLPGAWIRDHACGSNRPLKAKRDSAWLEECLREGREPARNTFYLAQTYQGARRFSEAALLYQRRLAMGGWPEEVYLSHLELAQCLFLLGDVVGFQRQLWQAYRMRPTRAEALYRLAVFHFAAKDYGECLRLCRLGERIGPCDDLLGTQDELYQGKFSLVLLTCQARLGKAPLTDVSRARRTCRRLAVDPDASPRARSAAREIWKFCARDSGRLFGPGRQTPIGPAGYESVTEPICPELALEHLAWVPGKIPFAQSWLRLARDVHGMHRFAGCNPQSRLSSLTEPFYFCGSEGNSAIGLTRLQGSDRLLVELHSARDGSHFYELALRPVLRALKPIEFYR